jgi:2-C-methyl-D-erythritol 4-phosphate cytidylyltransferase
MRAVALLAAGGRGHRLQADVPKALVHLAGKPLLRFSLDTMAACAELEAVVVAAPIDRWNEVEAIAKGWQKVVEVVKSGESRQASILNALEAAPSGFDAVLCHDVARPFASSALFAAVLGALDRADGVVPILPVHDTVKRVADGMVTETVSRDELGLAQTPQAFRRDVLEAAHRAATLEGFEGTDDAALVERAGFRVVVVAGEASNMKLTTASDLAVASALAASLGA